MPFLSHVIQHAVAAPAGIIGFADTMTSVVDGQLVTARTPDVYGSYSAASGFPSLMEFDSAVPYFSTELYDTQTSVICNPEPGREWTDHIGVTINGLTTSSAVPRVSVYVTMCHGYNPTTPPRVVFQLQKDGDASYRVRVFIQGEGSGTDVVADITQVNRTGDIRLETKVVNDNEIIVACNYNGEVILAPTTFTQYDFSTRQQMVALRAITNNAYYYAQLRGNTAEGQFQIDSIPTLITE